MIEGAVPAQLREGGSKYDIRVRVQAAERRTTEDLAKLTLITPSGKPVKLGDIARFDNSAGLTRLERLNRLHQVTIAAQIAPGWSLGDVVAELQSRLQTVELPPGYSYHFGSQVRQMVESFGSLYFAIGLAVVFTYMVLASLFGSYLHPFTIMLSLPLAAIGALLALYLSGQTLNTLSLIGFMLLIGLVTKNAILIIAFAKVRREAGMERRAAILEAAQVRLRPILMTSLTTIFAMLPLAAGLGTDFELRQPMAFAVIGGMLSSTVLTLIVIPLVYTLLDEWSEKISSFKFFSKTGELKQ
jgi:HAE1 family hydrophobic/amphiphilic exporter-1